LARIPYAIQILILNSHSASKKISIVIAHATAGVGHRRAAEAIAESARMSLPDADIHCIDILSFTPRSFRVFYPWFYDRLVRFFPFCWSSGYKLLDNVFVMAFIRPIRRFINRRITDNLKRKLLEWKPDVVIATHFLPADLFGAWKSDGWLSAQMIVVVTDVHPHRIWLVDETDRIVVNSDESASVCRDRGIADTKISATGIPVSLTKNQSVRENFLNEYGFTKDKFSVLIVGGGTTLGAFLSVAKSLMQLQSQNQDRMNLIIVCGSNTKNKDILTKWAESRKLSVRIVGFIDHLADLMASSDIIVAKAGGLIMTEALAVGLPLIIYHAIPGQEQMNADYIIRHNAGRIVQNANEASLLVSQCLDKGQVYKEMKKAAISIGRPMAAARIIQDIVIPFINADKRGQNGEW